MDKVNKLKISFDFDSTLEYKDVQDVAINLIKLGYNVCILTTRYSNPMRYSWAKSQPETANKLHQELFDVAKKLGIEEINFTEFEWKHRHIDKLNIDIHIDDNLDDEVRTINSLCKASCIHYGPRDWISKLYIKINELEDER